MTTRQIIQGTIIIAIIAFIAAFSLSHINDITSPVIKAQQKEKEENALSVVLPGYTIQDKISVPLDEKDFTYWTAQKRENGMIYKAFAFITSHPGYSGDIRIMVGVNRKDEILGLSILSQTETPGLGARCTEVATTETFFGHIIGAFSDEESKSKDDEPSRPWFQKQFAGLEAGKKIDIVKKGDWQPSMQEELQKKNAVTAITGSTITTKAVRDGIQKGIENLHRAREKSANGRGNAS